MKLLKVFLPISILTFVIGWSTVWLVGLMTNSEEPHPPNLVSVNDSQATSAVESIPPVAPEIQPRFTGTGRGCGFGWWQNYETNDGQQLLESSTGFDTAQKARAELEGRIAKAVRVVKHDLNFTRNGQVGERIVMINPSDKNDKESVSILWYGGGQFVNAIDAPSLELALEFESVKKLHLENVPSNNPLDPRRKQTLINDPF